MCSFKEQCSDRILSCYLLILRIYNLAKGIALCSCLLSNHILLFMPVDHFFALVGHTIMVFNYKAKQYTGFPKVYFGHFLMDS
jgi:hypothetical protein